MSSMEENFSELSMAEPKTLLYVCFASTLLCCAFWTQFIFKSNNLKSCE